VELLYVVEFTVGVASDGSSEPPNGVVDPPAEQRADATTVGPTLVYDRIVEHLVAWQNYGSAGHLTAASFAVSGSTTIEPVVDDAAGDTAGDIAAESVGAGQDEPVERRLTWEHLSTGTMRYLRLTARTPTGVVGKADFVCDVSLLEERGAADQGARDEQSEVRLRIELGREALDEYLAPTGVRFFRRPFLLVMLTGDPSLHLETAGARVDGRFAWVNPKHVDAQWRLLQADRRLPVLMVDADGPDGDRLAWRAAGELAGLAWVRCVDRRARSAMQPRLDGIGASIPDGGSRLVWPNLDLRHPSWPRMDPDEVTARLLRLLAGLSVPARGNNELARAAAWAVRRQAAREHELALEAARAEGDLSAQVAAQEARIRALEVDEEGWLDEIAALEAERNALRTKAAMAAYWKERAEEAWDGVTSIAEDWDDAPALKTDLDVLAAFLTKHSKDAIVFTPAASRSWRQDKYPKPEEMREVLVTLAKASAEYRRLQCRIPKMTDDWFKQVWDLAMASTDKYMSDHKLDKFTFEKKEYSRLPHIKLDDRVAPSEVGRIYFAMDSEKKRFIVDHVGLKLYGL
jgi:hypothetical protein